MKFIWIILFAVSLLISQDEESVRIYRLVEYDRLKVYAKNENIYPVTIEVKFDLKNLESTRYLPFTGVINASTNEYLFDLEILDIEKPWDYSLSYKFYMGSIFARHNDDTIYQLPFGKGQNVKLSQGYDGVFSHHGDLKYSLDFDLEKGSAVYAARDGIVVDVEESNDRGGPLKQYMNYANYITIMHDDGTFADYSHLMQNGAQVETGQQIKAGELIGYSGDTGYASGPHLHFVVKKARKGGGYISIPVKFATEEGIVELQEGQSYN